MSNSGSECDLPTLTPNRVKCWYRDASQYFSCVNLGALSKDATEEEVREAFEADMCSLEHISINIGLLISAEVYED